MNLKILTISLLVLVARCTAKGDKQIKLEDIERDNLLSEAGKQQQSTGGLVTQQTQHLRPPGIQAQSVYHTTGGGVVYAPSAPEQHNGPAPIQQEHSGEVQYSHQQDGVQYLQPQDGVQYATLRPDPYQPQGFPTRPPYTPVHEADGTYASPSRDSLLRPILPTAGPQEPLYYGQPQPQYVYVQQGGQPVAPIAPTGPTAQGVYAGVRVAQHPSQQPQVFPQEQQYQPVYSNGIGPELPIVPITPRPSFQIGQPQSSQVEVQQSISYRPNPVNLNRDPIVVSSTPAPTAQDIQYANQQTQLPQQPLPQQFPNGGVQYQQQSAPGVIPLTNQYRPQYFQQQINQFPGQSYRPSFGAGLQSYDPFGAYNQGPRNLLESYVPSSLILQRQQSLYNRPQPFGPYQPNLYQQQQQQQSFQRLPQHFQQSQLYLQQQSKQQPQFLSPHQFVTNPHEYNTIAYSTNQNYSGFAKRSPSKPNKVVS